MRDVVLGESKQRVDLRLLVSTLGLLMGVSLGSAEPPQDKADWNNLKKLVVSREIQIALQNGKSYQGKFQSVSDEALVAHLATGDQSFDRQTILRVSSKGQGHRVRNTILGAAVGFGVGPAIDAAAGNPNAIGGRGITALVGGVIGVATGAVAGAALPASGWRDVYRTR